MTTDKRDRWLQLAVRASAWWMALQALLLLLQGERLSSWLQLRWLPVMAPYVRLAGLSLLALALFVHRGVEQARRQVLAVDTLLLFFLGQAALTLHDQVAGRMVTTYEWACAAMDLGFAAPLLLLRTSSRKMRQAGGLLQTDARALAGQTLRWVSGRGPKPEAGFGALDPVEGAKPEPLPEARWTDGSAPLMPKAYSSAPPGPSPEPVPEPVHYEPAPELSPDAFAPKELPKATLDSLLALPVEEEPKRSAPLVPAPPSTPAAAPLPPPSPKLGLSEPLPRLD